MVRQGPAKPSFGGSNPPVASISLYGKPLPLPKPASRRGRRAAKKANGSTIAAGKCGGPLRSFGGGEERIWWNLCGEAVTREGGVICDNAGVMELVDIGDLKSPGRKPVWVRIPPPAPENRKRERPLFRGAVLFYAEDGRRWRHPSDFDQARSKRSRFMTLCHAATKSLTKASCESSHA